MSEERKGTNEIIKDLKKEVSDLKNILVEVTHHEGALEECRGMWEKIVKKELKERSDSWI